MTRPTQRLAEDARLKRRLRGGDLRAREALVLRYLPLARRLAWRYRYAGEPMDDLVQVASLGLVKAVDRWDPDRGYAFSTFAVPTIVGELRRHFRDIGWVVRPPRGLQELILLVERTRARADATQGREPTVAELAERLGHSPQTIREALRAGEGRWAYALEGTGGDEDSPAPDALLAGQVDDGYEAAEARATIERLSEVLDDRAREILRLRYEDDLRQADIAERVGFSQMHVSRLIRSSIERLQLDAAA
jgi:RNA polymerase sigma-B factor